MKKIIAFLFFLTALSFSVLAQNQKVKYEPSGKWQFEAPYAPEEYKTGVMEFVKAEGKYTAFVSFTGSDYKIPLEKVTIKNDSIYLNLYVEGTDVPIKIKMENETKLTGVAYSTDGDIPLTATRVKQ
jgi:hypothetical protein